MAEMTYVLRLMVDKFERRTLSADEQNVLMMAYEALRIPSREVHEMANMMEDME
jgi:predicted metallopeptidase